MTADKIEAAEVEAACRAFVTHRGGNPDECISGYSWLAGEGGRPKAGSVCHTRNWERYKGEMAAVVAALRAKAQADG